MPKQKDIDAKLRALDDKEMEAAQKEGGYYQYLLLHAFRMDWDVRGNGLLYKYFAEKYHWTPEQVRKLTDEEISALVVDNVLNT